MVSYITDKLQKQSLNEKFAPLAYKVSSPCVRSLRRSLTRSVLVGHNFGPLAYKIRSYGYEIEFAYKEIG